MGRWRPVPARQRRRPQTCGSGKRDWGGVAAAPWRRPYPTPRRSAILPDPSRPPPPLPCTFETLTVARRAAGRVLLQLALLLALLVGVAVAAPTGADRADGERRVWRVDMEHLNALNVCCIRRLMAQHP